MMKVLGTKGYHRGPTYLDQDNLHSLSSSLNLSVRGKLDQFLKIFQNSAIIIISQRTTGGRLFLLCSLSLYCSVIFLLHPKPHSCSSKFLSQVFWNPFFSVVNRLSFVLTLPLNSHPTYCLLSNLTLCRGCRSPAVNQREGCPWSQRLVTLPEMGLGLSLLLTVTY